MSKCVASCKRLSNGLNYWWCLAKLAFFLLWDCFLSLLGNQSAKQAKLGTVATSQLHASVESFAQYIKDHFSSKAGNVPEVGLIYSIYYKYTEMCQIYVLSIKYITNKQKCARCTSYLFNILQIHTTKREILYFFQRHLLQMHCMLKAFRSH